MSEATPVGGPYVIAKRVWIAAGLLVAVIVAYVCSVTVVNLPPSPGRTSLVGLANRVVNPWFAQQWTLFAPAPPTSNARLYLRVDYRDGNRSRVKAFDLSETYQRLARATPWAPVRLYRITMDLAVVISQIAVNAPGAKMVKSESAAQSEANVYQGPSALGTLRQLTPTEDRVATAEVVVELRRLLSASAMELLPKGSDIERVRALETSQPLPAFETPHTQPKALAIFDTGWMPFAKDVAL